MIRPGGEPAPRRWCRQEGSLATALSLVIVGLIPFELAKELCYLPLFSARDELSQSKGYCSLLRGFAAEFKNQIKKLGIKSEICGHVRLHVWKSTHISAGRQSRQQQGSDADAAAGAGRRLARPVGLCPFPSAAGSCRPLPGGGTAGGAGAQVSARRRGMGLALGIPAGHAEPRSALGRAAAASPVRSDLPAGVQAGGSRRGPCRQASAVGCADFRPGRAQAAAPRGAASAMVPIGRPAPDPRDPEKAGVGGPKLAGEAPQASPTPGEGKARPA